MPRYRMFFAITGILGVVFMLMQINGFYRFEELGMKMIGVGSNPAFSFVLAIAGLHIVHVLGGVIALIIIFFKAFGSKTRNYDSVPIEIITTYWHFVDLLWVYLFVFFSFLH